MDEQPLSPLSPAISVSTTVALPRQQPNATSRVDVRGIFKHLRRHLPLWVGLVILGFFLALVVAAPLIATHDPLEQDLLNRLKAPSAQHWFGTDELGRDVFSRVVYGTRVSLPSAVVVVILVTVIGSLLGAVAGFYGGLIGGVIMRLADLTLAFPGIVLALAIASLIGPSLQNMLLAACFVLWPEYARLMRSQVLVIRSQEYVTAARSYGMPERQILFKHVLPNAWTPLLIKAALDVGGILLLVSALSFFGLGIRPPTPEWGAMISEGQAKFFNWWIATFPGLAIFFVMLGFNLVSEGLRDWLDPRERQ
ncbi:MAG: ABC transporter permease [bacterium]|nr:ABC transporter permease [bacterium]